MTGAESPDIGSEEGQGAVDRVEITLPARPELLLLARMTAAAVASRSDFGYDRIEDLRLALDELCLILLEESPEDARMHLNFSWSGDVVEVVASIEENQPSRRRGPKRLAVTPKPNELSERILDALVDAHGFDRHGGSVRSWLRMRKTKAED